MWCSVLVESGLEVGRQFVPTVPFCAHQLAAACAALCVEGPLLANVSVLRSLVCIAVSPHLHLGSVEWCLTVQLVALSLSRALWAAAVLWRSLALVLKVQPFLLVQNEQRALA